MKKVIKGKVYDTEKAKKLAEINYGENTMDLAYWCEILYQKKTGEFFLYGEGGPMTKYAVYYSSNSWSGGSLIMPMSWEDARQWAEKNLDGDKYEEIFGKVTEDESKMTVTLRLPTTIVEKAKREAAKNGIGFAAYIAQIMEKSLN